MLIHARSLFGVPLGRSRVRVPIGDPRVGVPIGVAPGQGLGGPWPLGPPEASWALGTGAPGPPLGHPPRPLGLGSHRGVSGSDTAEYVKKIRAWKVVRIFPSEFINFPARENFIKTKQYLILVWTWSNINPNSVQLCPKLGPKSILGRL